MIISESRRFVFLHNPKCAGTSARTVLRQFDTRANFYWGFAELDGYKIDKAHMPLHIFRRFAPQDYALLDTYFVFGFVRDPYARAISGFNESHPFLYKELKAGRLDLEAYRARVNAFLQQMTQATLAGWTFKFRHLVPQASMFWFDGKRSADVLIKVEEIAQRLEQIAVFLPEVGEQLIKGLGNRNEKPLPYTAAQILDETTIALVNDIYRNDFVLFGYPMM